MKRIFIYLLLLPLAILACKDSSTGIEEPEEIIFGTWKIVSETEADWIGQKAKSASLTSDSLYITTPEQFSLDILDKNYEGHFTMTFVDSTETRASEISHDKIVFEFPNNTGQELSYGGHSLTTGDFGVSVGMNLEYNCQEQLTTDRIIHIKTFTEQDSLLRFYEISVDGLNSTLKFMLCD